MNETASGLAFAEAREEPRRAAPRDYLIRKDGRTYAAAHVLADFWGASGLDETGAVEVLLRGAAEAAGATVLQVHAHEFGGEGGVSGVAILAESHISVHTWPEIDYAAFDVFMCGDCRPDLAVAFLDRRLRPRRVDIREHCRGLVK